MGTISLNNLEVFSRRVSLCLGAGLDLLATVEREATHFRRLEPVVEAMRYGESFAGSLRRADGYFPPMFLALVEVAERSGMLTEGLRDLADDYAQTLQRRREFLNSLFLPLCELVIAFVIIGAMILVLGWVQEMTGAKIDPLGLGLVGVRGLVVYLAVLAGLGAGGWWLWRGMAAGSHRSSVIQHILMRIPMIGTLLRTLALARLTRSLFMTLRTGMDVRESLVIAFDSVAFAPVSRWRDDACSQLDSGATLTEALAGLARLDPMIPSQIAVGEMSGNTPEVCDRLSKQFMLDATLLMKRLSVIGFFVVYGGVAAIIIFFIFRLAMFYIGTINDALTM